MKVISVISGKGGVGKTTTVANLGAAFTSSFKMKVAIVDGNATTPDLGLHLGMHNFSTTLGDVLKQKIPIGKAIYRHSSGIKILPSSLSFNTEGADLRYLKYFSDDLRDYEIVLVDTHPGIGDEVVQTLEISDNVLIVTNPELPAITDALKSVELAKKVDVPIEGIILNRMRKEKYGLSVDDVQSVFDAPVVAVIPEDSKVRESIMIGTPIVLSNPSSSAAIQFKKLSAHLIGREYKDGFFDKLKKIFKLNNNQ